MPIVQVFYRLVYGNELIYPANEAAAKLAEFARVKTFNRSQVDCLRDAGLHIEEVRDPRIAALRGAA